MAVWKRKSMAVWKDLLPELLALTAKRLTSVLDYISFRGVCKSWRYAATFDNFDSSFPQVPWLMFKESYGYKFSNLSNNKIFTTPNLPREVQGKRLLSSRGWLLSAARNDACLYLWHPIKPERIQLPNWDTFPGCTTKKFGWKIINKMVLSGSPTIVSDLVVMVIWGFEDKKQLGFSRPGDSCWTLMEYWDGSFEEIVYHKDKLYAIDDKGKIVECGIHGKTPMQMRIILSIPNFYGWDNSCCMVESSEKLLIVNAERRILEFDLMDCSYKEIYDIGKKTLFLSVKGSSLCLEGFAWNDEVQPNCIYDADLGDCFNVGKTNYYCKEFVTQFGVTARWVVPGF